MRMPLMSARRAVEAFEKALNACFAGEFWPDKRMRRMAAEIEMLRGHDLACWCPLDKPCHADVLLRVANETVGKQSSEADVRGEVDRG